MINEGVQFLVLGDDKGIDVQLMEFGAVDPNFVTFVKQRLCDEERLEEYDLFYIGEIE